MAETLQTCAGAAIFCVDGLTQHFQGGCRESLRVVRRDEQACIGIAGSQDATDPADISRHRRAAERHSLQQRQRRSLVVRRQHEQVCATQRCGRIAGRSDASDVGTSRYNPP